MPLAVGERAVGVATLGGVAGRRSIRPSPQPCCSWPARRRWRWPRRALWPSATGSSRSTPRCWTACARGSRWSDSTTSSSSPTPRWSDLADRLSMPIADAIGTGREPSVGRFRRLGGGAGRQRRAHRGRARRLRGVPGALHGAGRRLLGAAHRAARRAARRHPRARGRAAQVRPDGDRLARAADAAGVACSGTRSCCARAGWTPPPATRSSAPSTARPSGCPR